MIHLRTLIFQGLGFRVRALGSLNPKPSPRINNLTLEPFQAHVSVVVSFVEFAFALLQLFMRTMFLHTLCRYIYIYMCIYIYICAQLYLYTHIYKYTLIHTFIHSFINAHTYIHTHIHPSIHTYVRLDPKYVLATYAAVLLSKVHKQASKVRNWKQLAQNGSAKTTGRTAQGTGARNRKKGTMQVRKVRARYGLVFRVSCDYLEVHG